MILQALVQLAENEKLIADPDFEFRPVAWVIHLSDEGVIIAIEDNRQNLNEGLSDKNGRPIKAKWIGRKTLVPIQQVRTSGDAALFAVDKAEYVLGVDPANGRSPDKLLARLNLFYDALDRCVAATGDASVKKVVAFGRHMIGQSLEKRALLLPKDLIAGDLLMFRVGDDGINLQARSSVESYWKSLRNPVLNQASTIAERRCLITWKLITDVPLFRKVKNMPGDASGGLSLVSFNASAWESYGWRGEDNAPVSREAAEAAVTALSRLLDSRPTNGVGDALPIRRLRMSDDTAVVFWSPDPEPVIQSVLDALPDLFEPSDNTASIANLFTAAKTGVFREVTRPSKFYAMTLTSVTGRIVLRDWLESTVIRVQLALRAHFDALACVRNTPPAKGAQPSEVLTLRELLDSLAAPGRERKIPTALAADFVTAAFTAKPYPLSILQRALLRERAEVTAGDWNDHVRRDARAALIKAVLTRDSTQFNTLEASMDENRSDPGYVLGRLMAVLEDTQRLASGGVNASVKDKFYGAASATPAAVFPTMMDLFHKHARKARDTRPGAVVIREKLVDTILAKLTSIPIHLDLKEQGLFILGYHHQRHDLYRKTPAESNNQTTPATEGATA